MVQFIVTLVLMLSFGTLLLLVARSLPRVEEDHEVHHPGLLDRWFASNLPEKIDLALNAFFVKFLRKSKVMVLKIDNTLTKHLHKVNAKKQNGGQESLLEQIKNDSNGKE